MSGGVDLQLDAHHALDIRASQERPDLQKLLQASASRASGYPIAITPDLLSHLDPEDAKANLRNLNATQITTLAREVQARKENLTAAITEVRKTETGMMYKAASPPDLPTLKDRVKNTLMEQIPGAQYAAELGERAGKQVLEMQRNGERIAPETLSVAKEAITIAEVLKKYVELSKTMTETLDGTKLRELARLVGANPNGDLTEVTNRAIQQMSSLQSLRQVIKNATHLPVRSEDALVAAAVKGSSELTLATAKLATARDWTDVAGAAQNLRKAMQEAMPTSGEFTRIALRTGANPTQASNFAAVAGRSLKVGALCITLAHQVADAHVMAAAARRDIAATQLLRSDLSLKRPDLEGRLRATQELENLIQERQKR